MEVSPRSKSEVRIRSAMPAIGVQSFHHSLVNDLWQARRLFLLILFLFFGGICLFCLYIYIYIFR